MESLIALLQPYGFSSEALSEIKAAFQPKGILRGDFFAREGETTSELARTSYGIY